MKKFVIGTMIVLASGCSSVSTQDLVSGYKAYLEQPRSTSVVKLTGVNAITITGVNMDIELDAQLVPLSILNQYDNTWDNIRQILGYGAMGYFGNAAIQKLAARPQVVQQQVVQPQVVTVPQ